MYMQAYHTLTSSRRRRWLNQVQVCSIIVLPLVFIVILVFLSLLPQKNMMMKQESLSFLFFVVSVLGKEWGYRNTHIPSTQEIYMYLVNKHIRSVLMQYNIISMYICVAIQCIVCTGPYITCPAPVSARPVAEGPFLSSRSFSSFASAWSSCSSSFWYLRKGRRGSWPKLIGQDTYQGVRKERGGRAWDKGIHY